MSEKKMITVVTQATSKLTKITDDAKKVFESIEGLSNLAEQMASDIELKQSELDKLSEEIELSTRKAKAELDVSVQENERNVLASLMNKFSLANIEIAELVKLKDRLEVAETDNEEAIEKAVKSAEAILHTKYNGELRTKEAEHKVATAELEANLNAKDQQIEYLKATINDLKETVSAEREARVKVAEAESKKQGVTVTNGKV